MRVIDEVLAPISESGLDLIWTNMFYEAVGSVGPVSLYSGLG